MTDRFAVPVNIICGALGAGKTTAIANLLANKPAEESWVVILNEFTDTGLDTLTLACAARGNYDVRMIPGGCLCCAGEEDFRRQLSSLLNNEVLPARIVIEPSGIGHPGSIIDELRLYERSGAIKLLSSIALVEPSFMKAIDQLSVVARDQIDSANVVLLSKAELADQNMHERFMKWANELFPAKRFIGFSEAGKIPLQALSPPDTQFKLMSAPCHHDHHHAHDEEIASREVHIGNVRAVAQVHRYLNREGCGWIIPDTVMFDLAAIERAMDNADKFVDAERFKAALRTGIDRWYLIQRWGDQFEIREIAWRNDSRIEVQLMENATARWHQWDEWIVSVITHH